MCAFAFALCENVQMDAHWDDLKTALALVRHGTLSGAADALGVTYTTVSRRISRLEESLGQVLFERSQTGYSLTPAGDLLLRRVRAMQAASIPVQELLQSEAETPVIRLSAGTATATFLADKYSLLSRPGDGFRLNFVTTEAVLDIAHREIDLGIRNRPAESGNLASRPLGLLRFAPFRSWSAGQPEAMDWVAVDPRHARHPAALWLHEQGHKVGVLASSVGTVHELVRAGAGIGIMPCLIGDCDPALVRAGPVIEDLTETQHLVMHNDDRHRAPLRRVIDRIVAVYRDNADLLAGERALRG